MRMLADRPGEQAPAARAKALNGAGCLLHMKQDLDIATALLEESVAIRRGLGDRRGTAVSLNNLALVVGHWLDTDYRRGEALFAEALAIQRELGDRWAVAIALDGRANNAVAQGDAWRDQMHDDATWRAAYERARAFNEEGLSICRELGDQWGIASAPARPWEVALRLGDYAAAREYLHQSLTVLWGLGDRLMAVEVLHALAHVALSQKLLVRSARLWAAAELERKECGSAMPFERQRFYEHHLRSLRAAFGDDRAFDGASLQGRAMTFEQAVRYALEVEEAPAAGPDVS